VPFTVALHCEVAFTAIAEGVQTGETEETVEDAEPEGLLPLPPQAISVTRSNDIPKAHGKGCLKGFLARWRGELPIRTCYVEIDAPSVSLSE
jgi:hypothetical protein